MSVVFGYAALDPMHLLARRTAELGSCQSCVNVLGYVIMSIVCRMSSTSPRMGIMY